MGLEKIAKLYEGNGAGDGGGRPQGDGRPQGAAPTDCGRGSDGSVQAQGPAHTGSVENKMALGELVALLKASPVRVRVADDRLGIYSKAKDWEYGSEKTWGIFGKISDLVFFNAQNRGFLNALPAGEYGGWDIEKKMGEICRV